MEKVDVNFNNDPFKFSFNNRCAGFTCFINDALEKEIPCSFMYKKIFIDTFKKYVDIYLIAISIIDDPTDNQFGGAYSLIPFENDNKTIADAIVIVLPFESFNSITNKNIKDKFIDFCIQHEYHHIKRCDELHDFTRENTMFDEVLADFYAVNTLKIDKNTIMTIYDILLANLEKNHKTSMSGMEFLALVMVLKESIYNRRDIILGLIEENFLITRGIKK